MLRRAGEQQSPVINLNGLLLQGAPFTHFIIQMF